MDVPAVRGRATAVSEPRLPVYVNPDVEKRGKFATGRYIKRWMLKLDLDYATVAEVLGVHPITVRNWEKAKSIRPIVKLAFDKAFRDSPRHRRAGPDFSGADYVAFLLNRDSR